MRCKYVCMYVRVRAHVFLYVFIYSETCKTRLYPLCFCTIPPHDDGDRRRPNATPLANGSVALSGVALASLIIVLSHVLYRVLERPIPSRRRKK